MSPFADQSTKPAGRVFGLMYYYNQKISYSMYYYQDLFGNKVLVNEVVHGIEGVVKKKNNVLKGLYQYKTFEVAELKPYSFVEEIKIKGEFEYI